MNKQRLKDKTIDFKRKLTVKKMFTIFNYWKDAVKETKRLINEEFDEEFDTID